VSISVKLRPIKFVKPLIKKDFTLYTTPNRAESHCWGNSIISMIYKFLANPDGGFLASSVVVKRPAFIDFDEIYVKVSLTPMIKCGAGRKNVDYCILLKAQKNLLFKINSFYPL
jgi:hypothetical protein